MYGTLARLRPKANKVGELIEFGEAWARERKPAVKGALASYLLVPERGSDEVLLFAVFADKQSYEANARDPEQDRWYQRMRDLLEADPTWEDGEIHSPNGAAR